MRSTRFLTTTLVGLAAFGAACADAPTATPTAVRAAAPSAAVITGVSSTPTVEQFKVCKVGSSATFSYTVDYVSATLTDEQGTVTLQDGECASIAQAGGAGANVTVTEASSQAGYALDHIDLTTIAAPVGACIGTPTSTTTNPAGTSASALIKGSAGDRICRGATAIFYNTLIPVGEIGDFVWEDTNNNGIQDAGEPGLAGITVTLGGAASATTTTDANGKYLFTGLSAGNYTVTTSCPANYANSPADQGSDDALDSESSPASVNLPANNSTNYTIDFGCVPPTGKIGDFVWQDTNNNGIQDAGEPGIPGVTVTLGGAASATTTTDANGKYLFTGLVAGNYTVTTSCPANYANSPADQGSDDALDSESSPKGVNLAANNSTDLTIDFGCVPPTGKIGDFVWEDTNGNGIQDAGEPGLQGIVVTLGGAASATTTTDAAGYYLFSGLTAGNYTVTVGAGPANYTASPANAGVDDAKDSDGTSPVSVTLPFNNSQDLTIDFGFVPPPPPAGGCTRTIGYWKTHAGFTGNNADVVTQYLPIWLGTANGAKSVKVTTATQAVSVLSMTGGASNGIVKLMAQMLGSKLSIASGADGSAISATIASADAFLAANNTSAWSSMTNTQKAQVNGWMTTFDNYNNGLIGPKHCQ